MWLAVRSSGGETEARDIYSITNASTLKTGHVGCFQFETTMINAVINNVTHVHVYVCVKEYTYTHAFMLFLCLEGHTSRYTLKMCMFGFNR